MNMDLSLLLTRVITLVIAFTVHEFSHALTAVKLGDETPRRDGRLTLNPLKHLDLFGTLMLIASGFGWAKPVTINTWAVNRKTKAGVMLVSLAGPLSNFLLAVIGAICFKFVPASSSYSKIYPTPSYFLMNFILINLNLMVFNLVPLAPLDGEKVLDYFIRGSFRPVWENIQQYGTYILIIVFFILPYLRIDIFGAVLSPIVSALFHLLINR